MTAPIVVCTLFTIVMARSNKCSYVFGALNHIGFNTELTNKLTDCVSDSGSTILNQEKIAGFTFVQNVPGTILTP